MLKQLERYSCSLNDAKRPPQTQLTVIVFQIQDEKKKQDTQSIKQFAIFL